MAMGGEAGGCKAGEQRGVVKGRRERIVRRKRDIGGGGGEGDWVDEVRRAMLVSFDVCQRWLVDIRDRGS